MTAARPLRIAFFITTAKHLRYYDDALDALLADGHEVLLGIADRDRHAGALAALEGRERRPRLLDAVPRRQGRDAAFARRLRDTTDFARYLDPAFAHTTSLRENHRARLAGGALAHRDTLPGPLARWLVRALLAAERALPSDPGVEAALRALAPDVVVVSPLVMANTNQTDLVKSARALGIPCAVSILSWDNLTTKGTVREQPDRLIVWNDVQRREATDLHGVPGERVVTTGAQPFDRWFGREPTADRETFCRRLGLDPARPYVLFAGSLSNALPGEMEDAFVRRWAQAVRAALPDVQVLWRPHPDRPGAWATVPFDDLEDVVLWPPERPNPAVPAARGEYFDSLFHAAAVAGINTSAMVEAAIIGRPVLAVVQPEFQLLHDGNLHFAYLRPENGGFLDVADTLEEHVGQLRAALADPGASAARNRRFVERFIRPHGMDRPAGERLAAAITALAGQPVAAARPSPGGRAVLAALRAGARLPRRRRTRRTAALKRRRQVRKAANAARRDERSTPVG